MQKRNIITGSVLIVALVAGIIAVSSIKPAEDNTEQKQPVENTNEVILKLETADEIVLDTEEFDIIFVNDNGTWGIEGIASEELAAAKVKSFVFSALSYTSNTVLDGEESGYGLDKPDATITIKADDAEHTVKIGELNAAGDVCFASVDGVKFTMGVTQRERLLNNIEYYTEFSRIAINADDITAVTIESSERTVELYIPETVRFEGNIWKMRKPYAIMANDTFIDSDVLPALGAVTLSEKADSLGKERAKVSVKTSDKEYSFKLGSVTSGKVAVEYGGETYFEPSELFAFVDAQTFEYMNKLVSYVYIDDVNSVEMEYNGVYHSLEIDGDTFKADGTTANTDASKVFYTYLIGMVANGTYDNEELGAALLKVTFNCKDNRTITVEYRQINEYTAAVVKNDETIFVTGLYDVEDLINKIEQFYM